MTVGCEPGPGPCWGQGTESFPVPAVGSGPGGPGSRCRLRPGEPQCPDNSGSPLIAFLLIHEARVKAGRQRRRCEVVTRRLGKTWWLAGKAQSSSRSWSLPSFKHHCVHL